MTAARTSSNPKSREPRRLYLFYGNKEAEINEAKLALMRDLIPDDAERRENVTEISPPVNRPLTLRASIPQILAELGQESLFGDSRRVVVVQQLQELFGSWGRRRAAAKKKTKSKSGSGAASDADLLDAFTDAIQGLLDSTPNAILFLAVEDDSKNRRVNDKSPLFESLSTLGQVRQFSAKSYRFELSDAVVSRSHHLAMEVITTWRRDDSKAAVPIFRTILDDVRLLLQAAIQQREGQKTLSDPDYKNLLFPTELQPNLQTIHDFRRRKYLAGVHNYPNLATLLEAMRGLLDIQKALYPTGDEQYVPDVDYLIDIWIARFMGT